MPPEIKNLSGSEVEIFIEVPPEEFDKYCEESFSDIAKNFEMPGFRAGKVPEKILREKIKEEDILRRAAESAIHFTYFPLIKEKKIEAIGRPEITITKIARGNPFCYKVKTFVLPEITLPDYKKIVGKIKVDFKEKTAVEKKQDVSGEETENKTQTVEETRRKEHLEDLKNRQKLQIDILEGISNETKIEIPDILIQAEKEKMLGELKSSIENMGLSWSDYLAHIKKVEDDLRKDWQEDALRRVKYGLIIKSIAEKENLDVTNEEVESEVAAILEKNPNLDKDYTRRYIYGILRNEKVLKFLEEI